MRHALIAGWVSFVYLLIGTSGAPFWLDSGELSAAAYELGVMHPPGAPGLGLLLRAATLLPIGSLAFKMAVVSALFGAGSVAGVVAVLRQRGASALVVWGAALAISSGWTFVRQARIVEVYAFATLLFVVVVAACNPALPSRVKTSARLSACFAATWAAWAFGDLRLVFAPLGLWFWLVHLRKREAWTRYAPVVVAYASTIALSLPLASARGPESDWGNPERSSTFVDHVMAGSIRRSFAEEILPASLPLWLHNASRAADQWIEDLGPLGPSLVLAGLLGLWVRGGGHNRKLTVVATFVLAVFGVYTVGINPMGIVDRQTSMVLEVAALAFLAEALRLHGRAMPRLAMVTTPLVWALIVLPAAFFSVRDAIATRSWGPHVWVAKTLEQLPPRAVLLTQSDDLAAGSLAAHVLEGTRPDVVSIPAQHLWRVPPEPLVRRHRDVYDARMRSRMIGDEAERIESLIADLQGRGRAVAIEHPANELFAKVNFAGDRGQLPVKVQGPGATARHLRPRAVPDDIAYWLPRLPSRDDRKRLAGALAAWARARVRSHGDLGGAAATLELSLSKVDADHASAWVALAALRDRMGKHDEAIAMTRRALELEPTRRAALGNLALYLSRDPQTLDEALELALRAVRLRPWRAEGWERLAAVRRAAGDVEGAAEAESHALRLQQPEAEPNAEP